MNGTLLGHQYSKCLGLLFDWFGEIKFIGDCRFIASYFTLNTTNFNYGKYQFVYGCLTKLTTDEKTQQFDLMLVTQKSEPTE